MKSIDISRQADVWVHASDHFQMSAVAVVNGVPIEGTLSSVSALSTVYVPNSGKTTRNMDITAKSSIILGLSTSHNFIMSRTHTCCI